MRAITIEREIDEGSKIIIQKIKQRILRAITLQGAIEYKSISHFWGHQ